MSTPPDISIIIANWNAADALVACLASIAAQSEIPAPALNVETIVVGNASTDGSVERVQQDFPAVTLIVNGESSSDASAVNQGLRAAQGRYLLLLNPGAVLGPGALAAMVTFMDGHPAAGIVGPRLVYPDGSLQPSGRPAPRLSSAIRVALGLRDGASPIKGRDYTRVQVVDELAGACLMIRREAMDKAGLLDEELGSLLWAVDLCLRVQQQGWQVYYLPAAEVMHDPARGSQQPLDPEQAVTDTRSLLRFFDRYRGRRQTLVLRTVLGAVAVMKGAALAIALPFSFAGRPAVRRRLDLQRAIISVCRHPGNA